MPNLPLHNDGSLTTALQGRGAGALVTRSWVTSRVREVVGSNPSAIYCIDIFHIDLL